MKEIGTKVKSLHEEVIGFQNVIESTEVKMRDLATVITLLLKNMHLTVSYLQVPELEADNLLGTSTAHPKSRMNRTTRMPPNQDLPPASQLNMTDRAFLCINPQNKRDFKIAYLGNAPNYIEYDHKKVPRNDVVYICKQILDKCDTLMTYQPVNEHQISITNRYFEDLSLPPNPKKAHKQNQSIDTQKYSNVIRANLPTTRDREIDGFDGLPSMNKSMDLTTNRSGRTTYMGKSQLRSLLNSRGKKDT